MRPDIVPGACFPDYELTESRNSDVTSVGVSRMACGTS
jgi:hypothetical protein